MGFPKKIAPATFDQSNVSKLASDALAKSRANMVQLAVRLKGETPLLMHRWSQKAIMEMVGKMVGLPVPKMPKDLTAEYEASYYRNTNGAVAMPCRIVKACIIEGAIGTFGVTSKAELKRGLRVLGYTSPLKMPRPMRADHRIASNNGSPDMRARAVIPQGYHFDVVLQFGTQLTPDKVISALESAGALIGLCDWRPERGGDYGTFGVEVLPEKEIARILKECALPEEEYVIPKEYLKPLASVDTAQLGDKVRKAKAVVDKVNGDANGTNHS